MEKIGEIGEIGDPILGGDEMRKGLEILFLVLLGFLYYIIFMRFYIGIKEVFFITYILLSVGIILFSIYTGIISISYKKVSQNSRAEFMGLSAGIIGILLIIRLVNDLLVEGRCSFIINRGEYDGIINYSMLIGLDLCLIKIKDKTDFSTIVKAVVIQCAMIIGLEIMSYYIESNLLVQGTTTVGDIIKLIFFILCLFSFLKLRGTIKVLEPKEQFYFKTFYSLLILESLIKIVIKDLPKEYTRLIVNFIECGYMYMIYSYIKRMLFSKVDTTIQAELLEKCQKVKKNKEEHRELLAISDLLKDNIDRMLTTSSVIEAKIELLDKGEASIYIEKIKKNCYHLLELSKQIKTLGQGQYVDNQFEETNLSQWIREILQAIQPYLVEKNIKFAYEELAAHDIVATVNKNAIKRIIINLLSNAIKYNRPNGDIKMQLSIKNNRICLCIQDTGIGIPKQALASIFKPFSRTTQAQVRHQEGSGLGLNIVRSLVQMHQGKIHMESELGKGTTVTIYLPFKQK